MFLRSITVKGVTRLYFYESYFDNGKTRQKCIENLGRLGSLTPKIPQSLDRLIFLCQIYFYVLRTIVLYGIMYLYIYNT